MDGIMSGAKFWNVAKSTSAATKASSIIPISASNTDSIITILDISAQDNWAFEIQSGKFSLLLSIRCAKHPPLIGALRRVISNLFTNALKFTTSGFIKVSMSLDEVTEGTNPSSEDPAGQGNDKKVVLRLQVLDTGHGMSPTFLRRKLFTPFSQENVLLPGNGLGLSIV